MSGIDIRNFLNNFSPQQKLLMAKGQFNAGVNQPSTTSSSNPPTIPAQNTPAESALKNSQSLQMNTLKSIDRSIYAKDLMQMPKNINEFVYMVQRGLSTSQFNKMFSSQLLAQRNSLSQIQAQILAQLQDIESSTMQQVVQNQLKTQLQTSLKNLDILSNGMINLAQISAFIQQNGKEALTKIIMTMTEASKSGITDLSQLKDMAKLINASIAVASENDPVKNLKLLILLYLPWLPLKDGVGFELEIEAQNKENSGGNSVLTVTITTVNYGVVIATLALETSNSVQIAIECNDKFPKKELDERINDERKHYSISTNTIFAVNKDLKPKTTKASANINMAETNEINPYLLLMAHTIIKHVIDIDNNTQINI